MMKTASSSAIRCRCCNPLWERVCPRSDQRAVTDKPQRLNRWQASSHAHRCCPPPLWERVCLRGAHRAVTDKPQRLNRWQAGSHAHRCCPHPLWERALLQGAHRAVADKPQRLNRWQASSHPHRIVAARFPYGSGFVCGGRTGLSLTNRSVLIAGKPAPTPIVAARTPSGSGLVCGGAHRAVADKPQCLNRWQASTHAHRCCPLPHPYARRHDDKMIAPHYVLTLGALTTP